MAKAPVIKAPTTKFEMAIVAGKIADAIKSSGSSKSGMLLQVPVAAINVMPGFNVRAMTPDYTQHRDEVAASIRANGFYETMPLAGFISKDGDTHKLYLTGGHTRFDAVQTINADPDLDEKDEIKTVPMIVRGGEVGLEDLTVALHTENDGARLTPIELGTVVKRLLGFPNATQATVAKRLGITDRYLRDVLMLVDSAGPIKSAVLNGEVSSTFAIQTLKTKKDKAGEVIAEAVKAARAKGATKATARDAKPATVKMERLEHTVSLAAGTSIKDVLASMAQGVRGHLGIPSGDGEITHDGEIKIVISRPAVTAAKVEAAAAKAADATSASETALKDAAAAKKPAKGKKVDAPAPAPETPPAPEPEAEGDDAIPPAGEVPVEDEALATPPPPAVRNGEGVPTAADDDDI